MPVFASQDDRQVWAEVLDDLSGPEQASAEADLRVQASVAMVRAAVVGLLHLASMEKEPDDYCRALLADSAPAADLD